MNQDRPRIPLFAVPQNRGETTDRDSKLINGYVEIVSKEEIWLYKRPAFKAISNSGIGSSGLGVYNWKGDTYAIWGTQIFKNGVALTAPTLDVSNGVYNFTPTLGTPQYLFFHNGVKAYYYSGTGSVTQVTDVNFPTSLSKGAAYLDGTIYVMDPTGQIRGSNFNDPSTWGVLNSINAQIEPDNGVFLAKQLVYIIAFQEWSTEVFYDAGNATGSPLSPVQGAKVNVGCRHAGTVQDMDGTLIWVSRARSGGLSVHMMEGLKAQPISTPSIERILGSSNYTTVLSWNGKIGGHRFYCLTLTDINTTLVYDLTTQLWSQWQDNTGYNLLISSSTYSSSDKVVMQGYNDNNLYSWDISSYKDSTYSNAGVLSYKSIPVDLYTPDWDAGTKKRKVANCLYIAADQQAGSWITIRTSDDDYQGWTTPRRVDLDKRLPMLDKMGTFRRRSHHIHHECDTPLRLRYLEMQLEVGVL